MPFRFHSIPGRNDSILTGFGLLPRRNDLIPGRGEGIPFLRRRIHFPSSPGVAGFHGLNHLISVVMTGVISSLPKPLQALRNE
jgi:hypothetical protein